jgi:CitMHS family citrate-Mg2+:H+ or citrate-Ca2+:H+ symporter
MIDRDIGDFQKGAVKWAVMTSLVVTALALLTGGLTLFV